MPRRRKITIPASELECFETLVRELHQRPEFAGFDPSSLHVWAYERYEPKLKDTDAILRRLLAGRAQGRTLSGGKRQPALQQKGAGRGAGRRTSDARPVDHERMAGAVPRSDLGRRRHPLCGQRRSGGIGTVPIGSETN